MDRIFSKLTIKSINEDQRVVEGIASTATVDRAGDIVEPLGAEYDLPIPFLLDHDHREAVGEVEYAEVTAKGIRFRARIKRIDEPGLAKDLVDKAWHLLKNGLRRCVSIGFQASEAEPLPSGGYRFKRWSWLELSAVSVPAQPDAVVTGLKRAPKTARVVRLTDLERVAAKSRSRIDRRKALGLPGKRVKLTGADLVEAFLGEKREERSVRARGSGDARLRMRP
jgi:phage head maturation protease